MTEASATPVALRQAIDVDELCRRDPCAKTLVLGSYWPHSTQSFESRLVKAFKECHPAALYEPHISHLCEFYSTEIIASLQDFKPKWVARVLSSSETSQNQNRPQSMLLSVVAQQIRATEITDALYRSQPRKPMRMIGALAGREALRERLRYAAEDLFIRPKPLGGTALLFDDICNTGASTRVYAFALKHYLGISEVVSVNMAATRFARGKDGRGRLELDTSRLGKYQRMSAVWLDSSGVFHVTAKCHNAHGPMRVEIAFIAERLARQCPRCVPSSAPHKPWWRFWQA